MYVCVYVCASKMDQLNQLLRQRLPDLTFPPPDQLLRYVSKYQNFVKVNNSCMIAFNIRDYVNLERDLTKDDLGIMRLFVLGNTSESRGENRMTTDLQLFYTRDNQTSMQILDGICSAITTHADDIANDPNILEYFRECYEAISKE